MANFKNLSRYTNGIITTTRSGTDFLVLRKPLDLSPDDGDVYVEITADIAQRPDLISSKAYGVPDLWWVIFEFNGISDPLFGVKPGQLFRIPQINRVLEAIKKLNKV
jgi:hypothetical protein